MEELLNTQVKNIEISGIRKFFNLVQGKEDIISLTIGQPDFKTPNHIKDAAKLALDHNHTTYTPNAGLPELRNAIQDYVKEKYQLSYDFSDEIIVTVGASQGIDITLRTILNPGDEVLLPSPVYPGYEPLIRLAGGIPVHVDTTNNGFKFTADLIEEQINERTKCVILPYPSNPTGVTLTEEELKGIVQVIKEKSIFLLADEIYSELTYDVPHRSIGTFEEIRGQSIIIQGLSKSHSMTGFRIGYVLAPAAIQQHILKVHQYNVSCATSTSQHAALEALKNGQTDPVEMRDEYRKRRDYVLSRLERMNIEVVKPEGAFYVFPKLKLEGFSSFDLAVKLLEEYGLALVPGDAFSSCGEGYVRLSYAYNIETLSKGLDRLESFVNKELIKK
ncbi:aromatic amino acid aminotransferase [Halalkalibacillus sediminis]|uniref:Aminotransferase n=1 Tax=Halalkalibacillus sediminis TaxID=2018042 RepID=A0A2I0QVY9_9BACI|nr:aminotransferase A [Halalkalibacillus sediminis]PKR78459.1 aromatic amino acid aminotransferase [Halalkalibacillus sediminis]